MYADKEKKKTQSDSIYIPTIPLFLLNSRPVVTGKFYQHTLDTFVNGRGHKVIEMREVYDWPKPGRSGKNTERSFGTSNSTQLRQI